MGNSIVEKNNRLAVANENNGLSNILKPLIKEIFLYDTHIAGTSYLSDKSVLYRIKTEDKLILQREDNEYDKNAILVLTQNKEKIGYIPRKNNIIFARLMDAGKLITATIKDINYEEYYTRIIVSLYFVDF